MSASSRVAILGAGPIGLEAGLAAAEHGLDFTVYDAAPAVGGHVRSWGHVQTFTPWAMNVSPRAQRALQAAGREVPDGDALPTGAELADQLLDPLASLPVLSGRIETAARVLAVSRDGLLKHEEIGSGRRREHAFRVLVERADGSEDNVRADVVIDATGTYGNPNRLGDGGIDAIGERAFDGRIERFLPPLNRDRQAWAGQRILLTGAGHSAQTAARELAEFARQAPGTEVVWAVRSARPDWGAVDSDPLPARARLNASASELAAGASPAISVRTACVTEALRGRDGAMAITLRNGSAEEVVVDRVLALNGGVGDAGIYRQLQVHECYATSGPMKLAAALLSESGGDCLAQVAHGPETLVNPEPDFFILGAKSYGRNSQFLLRIGWQQVDDVFEHLLTPG